MRPLFLLLGVWHGMISLAAALYGIWMVSMLAIHPYGAGPGWVGGIFLVSGLLTLPALGVAAQGGKGTRNAGAVLALPFFAMLIWSLSWGYHPGLWFYALLFLPGAILGAATMSSKEDGV